MPHTPRRSDVDSIRAENTANAKTIAALQKQLEEALAVPSGLPVVAGTSELKEAAREKLVTQAREELIATQRVVKLAQDGLNTVLPAAPPTSRAGHLRSLPELIGPPPPNRTWEDEWVKLKAESYRLSGQGEATVEEDEAYVRENDPIEKYVAQDGVQSDIAYLVEQGWPSDNAKVYALLFTCLDALARALSERDSCYAASTYAISETLFAQRYGGAPEMQPGDAATARQVLASMRTSRAPAAAAPMRRRSATYNQLPPAMYTNLNGLFSLASRDPQWEEIETPDGTGFRGLTSAALVHATFEPQNFTEEGFMVNTTDPNDPTKAVLEVQDSDIVCFRSDKDDELGAHSAILTSDSSGDFPPNTLFRLQGGYEAGEWEAPGGVFPMQRLLVVTATYQPPRAGITGIAQDNGGSKMCGTSNLLYNKREDFLKGLDDLIAKPAMTMKNEFARDDSWTDWQGVKYTAGKEWEYVNGPAKRMEGCTPGTRDEANNGKTPQDFLDKINDFIAQRRAENYGTMLTDEHAFLKLEEVLAVRLYTGPAYQPINAFLRQISTLHDVKFRNEVGIPSMPSLGDAWPTLPCYPFAHKGGTRGPCLAGRPPPWSHIRGDCRPYLPRYP